MEWNIPAEEEIPETRASKRFDERMLALIAEWKFPDQLPEDSDYKRPYLILFNGITSALRAMERMNFGRAKELLEDAQADAEEAFLDSGDLDDEDYEPEDGEASAEPEDEEAETEPEDTEQPTPITHPV